ncbi:hypothetical protein P4C99_10325 [Pontiellaceae bacterium B1224]|nr:hypothetical protein [Pontiellaceae bacterium B1224]
MKIAREISPSVKLPEDLTAKVWHYMDFWKFESLLQNRCIYCCRSDLFTSDQYEGRFSQRQKDARNKWLERKGCPELVAQHDKRDEKNRKKVFINCWCMSDYDLDLMWKSYTSSTEDSIAIQSTVERLIKVADDAEERPLDISTVTYFRRTEGQFVEEMGILNPFIHKDVYFELDQEIRILYWPNIGEPIPEGLSISVDLNTLIKRIVPNPHCSSKSIEKIRKLAKNAGLYDGIISSSRYCAPIQSDTTN